MKRYAFPLPIILLLFAVIALAAPGDKRPAVTSAAIGLGTNSSATMASVTATTSVTAPAYNSTAADGYHYVLPYNSVEFAGTPSVGMMQTTPTGPQWYTGSAWEAVGSGGGGTWGSITGTLSAQTDLQAALDAISAGGITMSTAIPSTPGSAYLNDSTHVLTVASSTGYTQFTGSFTAWDTTPDAFAFTDETDIALSTAKTSNAVTVAGINYPSAISVTGDTGYGYSKNSAACTATSGTVVAGDTVAACVTSSGSNSTATTATVTIGGVSDTYSVTTAAGASPTFSAFSIDLAGTGLTATLSTSTTVGPGGSGGLVLTCATAGSVTATYSSGSPGTSYAYTLSPTVYSGDTCTAAYTQPGDGLEGTSGGADVVTASGLSVTNGSEATQSVTYTDDFNRTNNSTLGSNWTVANTLSSPVIYNNQAEAGSSAVFYGAYWSANSISNNQWSQVTINTVSSSGGPAVRLSSSTTGGYVAMVYNTSIILKKLVSNTAASTLITGYNHTKTTGDIVKITANGNVITVYLNGSQIIQYTDAENLYPSGEPGVVLYTYDYVDDWTGGDL